MSRTAYEILGVAENASEARIERAYQIRLADVAANEKLSENEKQSEVSAIEEANRILSRANSRARYDRKLAATYKTIYATDTSRTKIWLFFVVLMLALVAGGVYWIEQREVMRLQAEEDRRIAEQKAAASAEASRTRLQFDEQQQREAAERQNSEEIRLQQAREQREREMQAEKFVALPQAAPPKSSSDMNRENARREFGTQSQPGEFERQYRQAQQEAERQKRFLEQLLIEEKAAAEKRAKEAAANNPANPPRK